MKIIDRDSVLEENRNASKIINKEIFHKGEMKPVQIKIEKGQMKVLKLKKPLGELITSDDIPEEYLKKVAFDVTLGQERTPLLYKSIYTTRSNPNFPKVLKGDVFMKGKCVWLKHLEGQEVEFGQLETKETPYVPIEIFTTGFEYTREMREWNEKWRIAMLHEAMGESYNKFMNHLHFSPILTYTYPSANKTAASSEGDTRYERTRNTIKDALVDSSKAGRRGSIILANSANKYDLEEAFQGAVIKGSQYRPLGGVKAIIYYDGEEFTVGKKTYQYGGVPEGKSYLIRPKDGFFELIKHDMRIEDGTADIKRLIEAPIVGTAWRGLYAYPENNVQEITLP